MFRHDIVLGRERAIQATNLPAIKSRAHLGPKAHGGSRCSRKHEGLVVGPSVTPTIRTALRIRYVNKEAGRPPDDIIDHHPTCIVECGTCHVGCAAKQRQRRVQAGRQTGRQEGRKEVITCTSSTITFSFFLALLQGNISFIIEVFRLLRVSSYFSLPAQRVSLIYYLSHVFAATYPTASFMEFSRVRLCARCEKESISISPFHHFTITVRYASLQSLLHFCRSGYEVIAHHSSLIATLSIHFSTTLSYLTAACLLYLTVWILIPEEESFAYLLHLNDDVSLEPDNLPITVALSTAWNGPAAMIK